MKDVEANISKHSKAKVRPSTLSRQVSRWQLTIERISALAEERPFVRELLIFMAFVLLTSIMTWPWVIHLRDACADPGDPYLHSWVMWWDFHQTFHDPLHLFNGTIFYPLPYTLAFTENDYGIALLFFPLYAIGLTPLTVNSIATFMGFAFSGYGAFRLTRTLTASNTAAWISGIVFAFIPYRLHVLSQITYVFSGWMPLLLEALIIFARVRSWKRAAWLGVAFTMNALSSLTWMSLSLVPLMISALLLVANNRLWRDRDFWFRGVAAAVASTVVLFPFLLPYLRVSKLYGFSWGPEMVARNSPTAFNWLVAEDRLSLWKGLGLHLNTSGARLFTGLAAPLLALCALFGRRGAEDKWNRVSKLLLLFDAAAIGAALFALGSVWLAGSTKHPLLGRVLAGPTLARSLSVFVAALIARFALNYAHAHPSKFIKLFRAHEAFWIGLIWASTGFLMSLGMNSWFFRFLYDNVFLFHSMREPSRAAMVANLGIAILAGIGATNVIGTIAAQPKRAKAMAVALAALILFDLHAAPMRVERGAPDPDQLALWLQTKSIRAGVVELPTGGAVLPHRYMLRAADHGKPLINAASTFIPKHATEISNLSQQTPIPPRLLDAMEAVPTSYLIIHNDLINQDRRTVFELFLARGVASGRLRFIRRLEAADVYAVVKTEPEAVAEQNEQPKLSMRDWSARLQENPENLLGPYLPWSQRLYRLVLLASGSMPRYQEFLSEAKQVGTGLFAGEDDLFRERERKFAEQLVRNHLSTVSDSELLARLRTNVRWVDWPAGERHDGLQPSIEGRAELLLRLANDPRFIDQEDARSLVLIHYFAYLRRNPDDPPDKDLTGFNYWVREVQKYGGKDLAVAFAQSVERNSRQSN